MRKIVIVGAGQSGLQLGIGLVDRGYDVTIVTNRTGEDIRAGRVMSSQCMMGSALARERALGLNLWDDECPAVEGIGFTLADGGDKELSWSSRLELPGQSVDQRVKFPRWMAEFAARGGKLVHHEVAVPDLEEYAMEADLVIVAAGKGEIAGLFERDAARSEFTSPQRALALTYVTGMTPRPIHSAVDFNLIPGVGEYFVFPALTTTGPCDIMVFEGVPGGPMDCWRDVTDPGQHLERSVEVLRRFVPWEAERCRNLELTDPNGVLAGRFPPVVRKPVATLPSGMPVLGLADVVVLNDPITGQGSNNASRCAASYLISILEHGDRPFTARFMHDTFERYWAFAQYVTRWTNALLQEDKPDHVVDVLTAAQHNPLVARRFVSAFDDARDFFLWFMDAELTADYLASVG